MGTTLIAPSMTSQVRDLVYLLGQQSGLTEAAPVSVTRLIPTRVLETTYYNSGAAAAFISVSLAAATAATTSFMYVGGVEVAQGHHVVANQSVQLVGLANVSEAIKVSTTASNATVLDWVEYVL